MYIMPKVEEVKVLNIDEVPYAVDTMSEAVQSMVVRYNEWNQKEADARDAFMMVSAAKNELSRQIIIQVRAEKEAAEAEAATDGGQGEAAAVNTTEAPVEE